MKSLIILVVALVLSAGWACGMENMVVSVEQRDAWGWRPQEGPDDVHIILTNPTAGTDRVVVSLVPFHKPILRGKGITLLDMAISGNVNEHVSMHWPENVWCWVRVFEGDTDPDPDVWTPSVSQSLIVWDEDWIDGFPFYGSYFGGPYLHEEWGVRYPLIISGTGSFLDSGNDQVYREAVHDVRQQCETYTVIVSHEYVQENAWKSGAGLWSKTCADELKSFYLADNTKEPYFIVPNPNDETTLVSDLPPGPEDNPPPAYNVQVGDADVLKPYREGPYKDGYWCYAIIQNGTDHSPFEIVRIADLNLSENTCTMERGQVRTRALQWSSGATVRVTLCNKAGDGSNFNTAVGMNLLATRPSYNNRTWEEFYVDRFWQLMQDTKVWEWWTDGLQNDNYFTRPQTPSVQMDAFDNMVAYWYGHGSLGNQFPFMTNARMNVSPYQTYEQVDNHLTWSMYMETGVNQRFLNLTDRMEAGVADAHYRVTRQILRGTREVPFIHALDTDGAEDNTAASIDNRRYHLAYATARGMVYLKKKQLEHETWNGEHAVDPSGIVRLPDNVKDDEQLIGWLGDPIEDEVYVTNPTLINEVLNPSFQDTDPPGAEWEWSGSGSWSIITLPTEELQQDGTKCAELVPDNEVFTGFDASVLSQDITLDAPWADNTWGALSFYLRAGDPRLVKVSIRAGAGDQLIAQGYRFAPAAYWERWIMRCFNTEGPTTDVRIEFAVGNGYEGADPEDAITVYLDDVQFRAEDWWGGLSRKYKHGMVLWSQLESAIFTGLPTTRLHEIDEVPLGSEAWADEAYNNGEAVSGSWTLTNDQGNEGEAVFLYGSPEITQLEPVKNVIARGGVYNATESYNLDGLVSDVAVLDWTGDGNLDVAALWQNDAGTDTRISMLTGNGSGELTSETVIDHPSDMAGSITGGAGRLAVADFDLDGNVDLAVANATDSTVGIYYGDGAGGYSSYATTANLNRHADHLQVADIDEDGRQDLICLAWAQDRAQILLTNVSGLPVKAQEYDLDSGAPTMCAIGDWDEDGHLDLSTSEQTANNLTLMLGAGDGTFASLSHVALEDDGYVVLDCDLDNDGHADLFTGDGHRVHTFSGAGDGTFAALQTLYYGTPEPKDGVCHIWDGDGRQDFALAFAEDDRVSIYRGIAGGNVELLTSITGILEPWAIAAGLMDGDRREDLVIGGYHYVYVVANKSLSAKTIARGGRGWKHKLVMEP